MARLQLNKSSLAKHTRALKSYKRFLPSLDLKRQQLLAERAHAYRILDELKSEEEALYHFVKTQLPMLSNSDIDISNLIAIEDITVAEENVVGIKLPSLKHIAFSAPSYSFLAKPHWVDNYCLQLKKTVTATIKIALQKQRINRLEEAVATITQRVNLFEQVLIPQAEHNIKRIRIFLSDEQMVAVVRAKIAKKKVLDQTSSLSNPIDSAEGML
ncbi:V-type ATP synthase subunit D [Alteromonas sp. ASW11-36]|uniref:V-type ATP synthase subunit D n=1 Tax=Alteromonas arenosi TaxID=3055817 RepID=A0ABT7SUF4_9ALTE|nr:V-type ATP synthase subunit D [Alteromonas sp. ASW11-36]MDM7859818.1 V-type ATP synthase subunit D [Alteromonas sp. ASW11-36]